VSGVGRMSPTRPQSHVQNTAAMINNQTIEVTPVLEPYSQGSVTLLRSSSSTMKRPMVSNGIVQLLGETASESATGIAAARQPLNLTGGAKPRIFLYLP
jgi:hypothetical protein